MLDALLDGVCEGFVTLFVEVPEILLDYAEVEF